MMFRKNVAMVSANEALPGRSTPMSVPARHFVNAAPLIGPWPAQCETLVVGMGCFWGAERKYWQTSGVYSTAVGYAGGFTQNPTYEEVCSGLTGHTEVVMVVWDARVTSLDEMLRVFWENHDPTQGMRQGNDVGTQYRSAVYYDDDMQRVAIERSKASYQAELTRAGFGDITTEIAPLSHFYYAEDYHQQYLGKNPNGYCGLGGTGVGCPSGITASGIPGAAE